MDDEEEYEDGQLHFSLDLSFFEPLFQEDNVHEAIFLDTL